MVDRLKKQLADDGTCIACWSTLRDPQLAASLARQRYDAVVLDMQHGFHDEGSILAAISEIAAAGKSPLVRLPVRRWDLAERALDYGALGVIAPMINTPQDAREFARAVKYPPGGTRSHGPRYAADLYGIESAEYLQRSHDFTFAFAMIETREAYDNLEGILETSGIDGILMGPSDFSISVRGKPVPDPYGPETVELVKDIAKRTRAAGKIAAAFAPVPGHANLVHSMGYRLVVVSFDGSLVQTGITADLAGLDFL